MLLECCSLSSSRFRAHAFPLSCRYGAFFSFSFTGLDSFHTHMFVCVWVCLAHAATFGSAYVLFWIFFPSILLPSTNKLKHNHLNHLILKIRLTRSHISGFSVLLLIRSRWIFFFFTLFSSFFYFTLLWMPVSFLFSFFFSSFGRAVNCSAK